VKRTKFPLPPWRMGPLWTLVTCPVTVSTVLGLKNRWWPWPL
jgi:hypothetical protein